VTVLVTGGGGFLGRAIAGLLLGRGDRVRVLGRSDQPALRAAGAEVRCGDVADPRVVAAAVDGCDAVIHTAARVGSWGPAREFQETNVGGTENVIAACRAHGIRRLVYTSSPSVAHGGGDAEGIDESHPYPARFAAHYPRTKAIAERLVLAANGPGLATVALRPHLIWGPGDTQLLPRVVARAAAGRLRLPGRGDNLVDCTYIDNAAAAHLLALDRLAAGDCAGRAYFISQGTPLPFGELLNRMLAAAGFPPVTKRISPRGLYLAGCLAEAAYTVLGIRDREPPVTRFVARQLTTAHWFDISAARRDLGYVPRVSIDEGLRRLAAVLRAQGSSPGEGPAMK
jgi:nucleoside-diphosphate-sugar epimerase